MAHRNGYLPIDEVTARVEDGLEAGMTTDQIASDCGVKYASLYKRLDLAQEYELLKEIDERRQAEGLAQRPGYVHPKTSRRRAA